MLKHLFQPLLDWYQTALESGGYWVVGLLMTAESSVLPLPSESIIPLAASWSHAGKIHIGIPGIVLAGALGSWLGATIVYWLARLAGRPLLMRLWPLHFDHAGKNPEKRKLDVALRRGGRVHRAAAAGRAAVRRHSRRHRADGLSDVFRSSRCSARRSGVRCCAVGSGRPLERRSSRARCAMSFSGSAARRFVLGGLYYFFVHRHLSRKPEISGQRSEISRHRAQNEGDAGLRLISPVPGSRDTCSPRRCWP